MDRAEALLDLGLADGPFCIVTDQSLRRLSGIEAVEMLRCRGVAAPAILLTSRPTPRLAARAARAGVTVLELPLLDDRLNEALRRLWHT